MCYYIYKKRKEKHNNKKENNKDRKGAGKMRIAYKYEFGVQVIYRGGYPSTVWIKANTPDQAKDRFFKLNKYFKDNQKDFAFKFPAVGIKKEDI